jgi:hypothetical protein
MHLKGTDHYQQEFMSIAELDHWLEKNPDWECVPTAPAIISGTSNKKPDDGFRDLLKQIKKNNSRGMSKSNIETF